MKEINLASVEAAISDALKWAEQEPYGDLRMNANRAAGIAAHAALVPFVTTLATAMHDDVDESEHCCGCRIRDAAGQGPVTAPSATESDEQGVAGVVGWFVPDGAICCPRCRDINWDEKTRECFTCARCTCGSAAAGRGTGPHEDGCPEGVQV